MAKKVFRGATRGRRLTEAEAANYRQVRQQIEQEIPPAKPDPMKVVIAKLRALREASGLSLADVAERTGMTRGNLARLESQKNATLRTLERYANGLGCVLEISVAPTNGQNHKKAPAAR